MSKLTFEEIISKPKANYEVIPLGINCTIAGYLRTCNLRKHALPFDWVVTPIQSAIKLIDNGFDGFLCRDNLVFGTQRQYQLFFKRYLKYGINLKFFERLITPVICQKYRMLFVWDFLDSSDESYQNAYLKYSRRIQRLKDLLVSEEIDLIFVAYDGIPSEWERKEYAEAKIPLTNNFQNWKNELSIVLEAKYPQLNYTICDFSQFSSYFGNSSSLSHKIRIRHKIRKLISSGRSIFKFVKHKLSGLTPDTFDKGDLNAN